MLPFVLFAFLILLFWLGNPLMFLFFPGALLYPLFRKTFSEQLVYCMVCSLAFWIISAWFVKFFGFSYFSFAMWILVLSICAFPIVIKKYPLTIRKEDYAILLFFFLIIVLRFIPMTQLFVAPGNGDMSEHTYPVVLILWNEGLPDSYQPLLPIDHFGAYATGFHTIAALFSWFGNIPEYQATFLVSVLAHALITLGLYVLLRIYFSWHVAGITSFFASFFTTYPQLIFHWGGNPTVLSFFFVLIFAAVHLGEQTTKGMLFSALFLIASLLTHVAFMDVDLATDITHLRELISCLDNGADFAIGSRYKGIQPERTWFRSVISKGYNAFMRLYFWSKMCDHQCGFKAFKKNALFSVLDDMNYNIKRGWFWDAELLIRAQKKGLKITEFPVHWRFGEKSSFSILREIKMIPYVLLLRWRLR